MAWKPAVVAALLMTLLNIAPSASADAGCAQLACHRRGDGLVVSSVKRLPGNTAHRSAQVKQRTTRTEWTRTPGCAPNDPNVGGAYDLACSYLTTYCATRGLGDGWLTWVWSRPVSSAGQATGRWTKAGISCAEKGTARPPAALTPETIARAFRRVRFTRPTLHVQPEGNTTLVNLATYFEVTWPAAGYQPGEVVTVRLLGRSVRIRPRVASFTYSFGDGARRGPTQDAGGPYPTGRITHSYRATGTVPAAVAAVYTGEYSVGGAWEPIAVTVPVAGTPQPVQVLTATNQLQANP